MDREPLPRTIIDLRASPTPSTVRYLLLGRLPNAFYTAGCKRTGEQVLTTHTYTYATYTSHTRALACVDNNILQ